MKNRWKPGLNCMLAVTGLVLSLAGLSVCDAGDWPGLLGPFRNGQSESEPPLSTENSAAQLSPKWRVSAGQGYAGMAIAGGKAVLFDRDRDQDRVRYVDSLTGSAIWERSLPAHYRGGIDADTGPRCVPTLTDRFVVVYSAAGDLTVLSKADGQVQWTRRLRRDTDADDGYFGAGSTPLVIDDRIIVNTGGKRAGVLCVSLAGGKDLWSATDYDASYASPIRLGTHSTSPNVQDSTIVVPTRLKTIGLDINSGKVLWETPFGQRGPTVNAATPIPCKPGELFLTASYGTGNVTLRPSATSVAIVHQGDQLNSQYATPVFLDGWVYGSDGREDMGGAAYKCLDSSTGEIAWAQLEMPICHSILVNRDQLLLIGIDGRLWLIKPEPQRFSVIWQSRLSPGIYRALPAFSDHQLFVRSNGGNDAWQVFEF